MASTVKCQFCGKEVTKGFLGMFGGEAKRLSFIAAFKPIHCCSACYEKYRAMAENEDVRFSTKMLETKSSTGDMAKLFAQYCEEGRAYRNTGKKEEGFFAYTYPDKRGPVTAIFTTKEINTSDLKDYPSDSSDKLYQKPGANRLARLGLYDPYAHEFNFAYSALDRLTAGDWMFQPNDFAYCNFILRPVRSMSTGLLGTKTCYVQEISILLNDPKTMTYKPCMIEGVIFYYASLLDYSDKGVQVAETALADLKKDLGIEAMKSIMLAV